MNLGPTPLEFGAIFGLARRTIFGEVRSFVMSQTRVDTRFAQLKAEGKKGFVAYITAGDPNLAATEDIVYRLEDAGTVVIELGVPFSDPLADGAANQRAAERGLASGTSLRSILAMVKRIRERSEIPLVLYSYLNPIYAYGVERCFKAVSRAGFDGCLLVDLSMEEATPYVAGMNDAGLNCINLVTPTTPEDRIPVIAKQSSGFIYVVSREGVTGEQSQLQNQALPLLRRTHKHTSLPVALGFGVSTPEQARTYAEITDAVVVGSYIVNAYHEAGDSADGRAKATRKIKRLIKAVKDV